MNLLAHLTVSFMTGAVSLSQQLRHTAQDPDTHHIGPLPATAMVDSKMFTPYVPNAIKVRNRSTPAQLAVLEDVFVTDKKPNAPKRKNLAKKVGLSPRDVQVCAVFPAFSSFSLFLSVLSPIPFPEFFLFPSFPSSAPGYLISSCFTKRCGSRTGALRKRRRLPKRTHRLPPPVPPPA